MSLCTGTNSLDQVIKQGYKWQICRFDFQFGHPREFQLDLKLLNSEFYYIDIVFLCFLPSRIPDKARSCKVDNVHDVHNYTPWL